MNILITSPSLDIRKSVNGISAVVNNIIYYNKTHKYFHYILGRNDKSIGISKWLFIFTRQLILFPFALKKNKINLVHQNVPLNSKGVLREYVINLWCRLFKIPVLLHIHGGVFLMNGTKSILLKQMVKSLLRRSKKIIVLSEIEKVSLKTHFNFSNAFVLSNSIDVHSFQPLSAPINTNLITFLFLGRIVESKGIYQIIDAFKKLIKEFNFRFILCGEGDLKQFFIKECESLLRSNFEFRGIVSGNEKLKTMYDAHIFLLPSLYGEGLPIALLETMSVGLVPVVTDDASMKLIVSHKENGLIVKKNDSFDLYENIKLLLNNKQLINKFSINASNTIAQNYNMNKYIQNLNLVYNSIIS